MPGKSMVSYGNLIIDTILYLPAVTYPVVGAGASVSNTFAVPGVLPGDLFSWNLPNPPAHLQIDNITCLAPGVLTILWGTDATGITPSATTSVLLGVSRADGANLGLASLPSALV